MMGTIGAIISSIVAFFAVFLGGWSRKVISLAIILIIALATWALWSGGASADERMPEEPQRLGRWTTWRANTKKVKISVSGEIDTARIWPQKIAAKKGDIVAIEAEGLFLRGVVVRNILTHRKALAPAQVVRLRMPGKDGEFKLNASFPTEFTVAEDGNLEFSLDLPFNPTRPAIYTVKGEWDKFKEAPVVLKVHFLGKPSGKGTEPEPADPSILPPKTEDVKKRVDDILRNVPAGKMRDELLRLKDKLSKLSPGTEIGKDLKEWIWRVFRKWDIELPDLVIPDMGAVEREIGIVKNQAQDYWYEGGKLPVKEMKKWETETPQKIVEGAKEAYNFLFNNPVEEIPPPRK